MQFPLNKTRSVSKGIQFDTVTETAKYEIVLVIESRIMYSNEDAYRYYNFIDVENEEEWNTNLDELKKLAVYDTKVEAEYGDQLVTLSTCDSTRQNGSLAIIARKIR